MTQAAMSDSDICVTILEKRDKWNPEISYYGHYLVYIPMTSAASVMGNVFCIMVIYPLAKTNRPGYWMQTVIFCLDVAIGTCFFCFGLVESLMGLDANQGPPAVHSSPLPVVFAVALVRLLLTTCYAYLLLMVCAAFHKITAIKWPFHFKGMNHRGFTLTCLFASYIVAIVLHYPDYAFPRIVQCDGLYFVDWTKKKDLHWFFFNVLIPAREFFRLALSIGLLLLFVIVSFLHREVFKGQVAQNDALSSATIGKLLLTQAGTTIVGTGAAAVWSFLFYTFHLNVAETLVDFIWYTSFVVNVVFYITLCSDLRRNILNVLGFERRRTSTVATINVRR